MLLLLKTAVTEQEVSALLRRLREKHCHGVARQEQGRYAIAITAGDSAEIQQAVNWPEVETCKPFSQAFKLAGSEFKSQPTCIPFPHGHIGGGSLTVIAGPCSIESETQIHQIAAEVAAAGATVLRGGAFKPRTSPYEFQGLGKQGLQFMRDAATAHRLWMVSEVMAVEDIDVVADYADILQIGARNMQNFSLLKNLGQIGKPILLKRGMAATYHEWLMAAEYILQAGNPQVILCERGIRTFEPYARNTLDVAAVPLIRELSHLPIIVDPSHGTGRRSAVTPMAWAAAAAGCDGVMIEVHTDPDRSFTDAKQAISPATFCELMTGLRSIGRALAKSINTG